MRALVEDDLTRAATFFSLAFLTAAGGGLLLGEPRLGVEWGFPLGVAFGAFAYVFLVPTEPTADGESTDDR